MIHTDSLSFGSTLPILISYIPLQKDHTKVTVVLIEEVFSHKLWLTQKLFILLITQITFISRRGLIQILFHKTPTSSTAAFQDFKIPSSTKCEQNK